MYSRAWIYFDHSASDNDLRGFDLVGDVRTTGGTSMSPDGGNALARVRVGKRLVMFGVALEWKASDVHVSMNGEIAAMKAAPLTKGERNLKLEGARECTFEEEQRNMKCQW